MKKILNNTLKWDGSLLGSYNEILTYNWNIEGVNYYEITIPDVEMEGNSSELGMLKGGVIYCTMIYNKDMLPCIVEEIKSIFGIYRCGIHRIIINNKPYILYYIPISDEPQGGGKIIWETPLNRLDSKHFLRNDDKFKKEVQKIITFCDIMALCNTNESSIRIRKIDDIDQSPSLINCSEGHKYIPISVNGLKTSIIKKNTYDCSIITKTLFIKWFGENTVISDVVKEMLNYHRPQLVCGREDFGDTCSETKLREEIVIISSEIRNKIDSIIKKYNQNYIWYSNFIIDRMSRHLLIN